MHPISALNEVAWLSHCLLACFLDCVRLPESGVANFFFFFAWWVGVTSASGASPLPGTPSPPPMFDGHSTKRD